MEESVRVKHIKRKNIRKRREIQFHHDSSATAALETEICIKRYNSDYKASDSLHGPQRACAHVRVTSRVDYQPDICKLVVVGTEMHVSVCMIEVIRDLVGGWRMNGMRKRR
ncbi:hypothetical protein RCOM_0719280 [Ricinus communis]|uniref:Uncharacterized protein n=1 Tax=Ricinus communis TaxID=3988 RepID=B9SBJ7_RICCO|nr:hypothetical protein RCOM_0719280 [Ricinus communis]